MEFTDRTGRVRYRGKGTGVARATANVFAGSVFLAAALIFGLLFFSFAANVLTGQ